MMANIIDLARYIGNVTTTIQFLRQHNLLHNEMNCCAQRCSIVGDISLSDGEIFQCNQCCKRYSIRKDSIYSGSKLTLQVLLCILYFFAQGSNVTQCSRFLKGKVSRKSIIQWYNYYRDVCTEWLTRNPVFFDQNVTVHIDECCLCTKRKYNKGAKRGQNRWIFGIVDNANHKCFIKFIPNKKRETLLPIIQARIPVGTTVNSDEAPMYNILTTLGYVHNTVKHKDHLVDPNTGIHTNWIENLWSVLKSVTKALRGSQQQMLDGHVDEFMYRFNRKHEGEMFNLLIDDISMFYPL